MPQPTEAQIRSAMNGHLCRCGTYPRVMKAIQRASLAMRGCEMSTRRDFLKAGGALVVGFSLGECTRRTATERANGVSPSSPRPLDLKQIDTWLAIHADNTATVYIGFAELGQGASTALLQVAADELDLDMSQVRSVQLDTNVTPNQGGTYSSAAINRGSPQIRTAAAEARLALLQLASKRLNAPVDRLSVSKGVVSVAGNPTQSATYGELVGDKPFNVAFTGSAPVKAASSYKLVGTAVPRQRHSGEGQRQACLHAARPVAGMLHGRVVRPRGQGAYGAGAKVLSVDESFDPQYSRRSRGSARRFHRRRRGERMGCRSRRAAIESHMGYQAGASGQRPACTNRCVPRRPRIALFWKKETSRRRSRGAPHVVTQIGRGPYQTHAPFSPNCAIADVKPDSALIISTTQDIYGTRTSLARMLGLTAEKIQVRYQEGASNYGHGCQDDVAQAAAIMSQIAGKPVRLQFMRWDEHGWDNYGPAHLGEVRAQPPMPPAESSRTNITAGSIIGATSRRRRN